MKAISIKEPWLSLIFNGEKVYETRTWLTKYRGPLLLVGSKAPAGPLFRKSCMYSGSCWMQRNDRKG